jgi:putative PEP-CTERM system integral membrane protein
MKRILNLKFAAAALFWSWNVIFLTFMVLGFTPVILVSLVQAVIDGWVPWSFLAFASILVVIPVLSVAIAIIALRGNSERLFALGYGVQGPLMIVLAVRFFALRELTPPLVVIIIAAVLGLLALLWQILDKNPDSRAGWARGLRLVGITFLLFIGLYISAFLAFYALPVATVVINLAGDIFSSIPRLFERNFFDGTVQAAAMLPFLFLGLILALYSGTLFVLMPIAVPIIYAREWWRALQAAMPKIGAPLSIGASAAAFVALVIGYVALNRQPQPQTFALLQNPPTTLAQAQALKQQEPLLRQGLLNAYLAQYRYTSAFGEVTHISQMYQQELGLSADWAAGVQRAYEGLLSPLLYQPAQPLTQTVTVDWERRRNTSLIHDSNTATKYYEQYFDEPINKAERPVVVNAVRSTWDVSRATQAWQAVDDREILLTKQELTLKEEDGYADVELYEVYQNQTNRQQEVVYYFNLPESAVVTGVWLGNSPDRSKRFVYKVSPRGAAQQVYREQVTVFRRDPALLEQIGPRQYRLRVFPIEPPQFRWDGSRRQSEEALPMHMWLTWRMLPEDGAWQLPRLSEKRNVYWSARSTRTVNGKEVPFEEESWLPASLPIANPITPIPRRVDFGNGQSVVAVPLNNSTNQPITQKHYAIVLDRSRSMEKHAVSVQAALRQLLQADANADVYLTASPVRGEPASVIKLSALSPDGIFYFGGQDSAELLTQFANLSAGKTYDAIIVLTDDSGYELNKENREVGVFAAPIWMVHLDGALPLGYDDKMLEAIQASGGGIALSVDDLFARIAARAEASQIADLSSGYRWVTVPTDQAAAISAGAKLYATTDGFASFAARRLILAEMQRNKGALSQTETLDYLHKIAVEQSIVTPYSSMIVLVNDEQRRRLEALEKAGDRFQREKEQVGETVQPVVTGVPEPHEWALIGIAVAMLAYYAWKRRKANLASA